MCVKLLFIILLLATTSISANDTLGNQCQLHGLCCQDGDIMPNRYDPLFGRRVHLTSNDFLTITFPMQSAPCPRDKHIAVNLPKKFDINKPFNIDIHFHGYNGVIDAIQEKYNHGPQIAAANTNTLLIQIQGARRVKSADVGSFHSKGEFTRFIEELLDKLANEYPLVKKENFDHLFVSASSAGFNVVGNIVFLEELKNKLDAIFLLDASYGHIETFASYVIQKRGQLVSMFTAHLAIQNQKIISQIVPSQKKALMQLFTKLNKLKAASQGNQNQQKMRVLIAKINDILASSNQGVKYTEILSNQDAANWQPKKGINEFVSLNHFLKHGEVIHTYSYLARLLAIQDNSVSEGRNRNKLSCKNLQILSPGKYISQKGQAPCPASI